MTVIKLALRNIKKNMGDYSIYFLTLMLSISLFYAFNSIQSQPALTGLSTTKQLVSEQMGILISYVSYMVAFVLAFLILYANGFLLKRRKKELGIYTLLGMEKRKISRIFTSETMFAGLLSLGAGLPVGILLSQGLSMLSLRLFAIDMDGFRFVFSMDAMIKTIKCFALIFFIVILFNARTVASAKLIDLLMAGRKNNELHLKNRGVQVAFVILSIICIVAAGVILQKNGILPSRENMWFQIALLLLAAGTLLFFYSVSEAVICFLQSRPKIYLKGLVSFLSRQIGSRIQTDFLVMTVVTGLMTVVLCGLTAGISTALTVNEVSKRELPFDLTVLSTYRICGKTDIAEYLKTRDVDIDSIAEDSVQLTSYEADFTFGQLFEGQKVSLWHLDRKLPECAVGVVSVSDFNKSMRMQGQQEISLGEDEFLVNCNYKGTLSYIESFLENHDTVLMNGNPLSSASRKVLDETWWMTSVGNNDRGTFIVPDRIAEGLDSDGEILLVNYKPGVNVDTVLQKMIPIGLDWETEGYRYSEKTMQEDMYYSSISLPVILCSYIGLVFLLICAALLSLKQLAETADNVYRYRMLQKIGTDGHLLFDALRKQIGIFFFAPLLISCVYSIFAVQKIVIVVEDFLNLHVGTNTVITAFIILLVYGGYFFATYLSCKRMVQEKYGE